VGKSEYGPDMWDCSLYVKEMQDQQNCSTSLLLELDGSSENPRWRVGVLSTSRNLVDLVPEWSVATVFYFPGRGSKTFEGALFRAVAQHDGEISRRAFQNILNLK